MKPAEKVDEPLCLVWVVRLVTVVDRLDHEGLVRGNHEQEQRKQPRPVEALEVKWQESVRSVLVPTVGRDDDENAARVEIDCELNGIVARVENDDAAKVETGPLENPVQRQGHLSRSMTRAVEVVNPIENDEEVEEHEIRVLLAIHSMHPNTELRHPSAMVRITPKSSSSWDEAVVTRERN